MLEFLKRRWWQAHYTEYVPSVPIAKQHVWDCNFQQYLVTPLRSFEVCREAQISKIMRLHNRPPKLTLRQHWWETCTIPHHSAMCAIRCGDVYFYVHDLGWQSFAIQQSLTHSGRIELQPENRSRFEFLCAFEYLGFLRWRTFRHHSHVAMHGAYWWICAYVYVSCLLTVSFFLSAFVLCEWRYVLCFSFTLQHIFSFYNTYHIFLSFVHMTSQCRYTPYMCTYCCMSVAAHHAMSVGKLPFL